MGPMGYGGLALANSLAVTAEVLALLAVLSRRLHGIQGRQLGGLFLRVLLAALIMGAAIVGVSRFGASAGWGRLLMLLASGALGLLVYLGAVPGAEGARAYALCTGNHRSSLMDGPIFYIMPSIEV